RRRDRTDDRVERRGGRQPLLLNDRAVARDGGHAQMRAAEVHAERRLRERRRGRHRPGRGVSLLWCNTRSAASMSARAASSNASAATSKESRTSGIAPSISATNASTGERPGSSRVSDATSSYSTDSGCGVGGGEGGGEGGVVTRSPRFRVTLEM